MTESEKAKIISLYESGTTLRQIRQLVPMTATEFATCIKELKANGELPKRKTGRDKVIEAYERGERNFYKIAEMYGLKPRTVHDYRVQSGITIGRGKRNFKHCDRTNAINADLQLGNANNAEIARKHGVSRNYVRKLKLKLEEDGEL